MQLSLVGFGEAGQAFAQGLAQEGRARVLAFDLRDLDPAFGVQLVPRVQALSGAAAVICLVTADRALEAARECAPFLPSGAFWFDGNSCAPSTKRRSAEVIATAGGQYVDMAIMAPVHPRLHRTPVLLSGSAANQGGALLTDLGFQTRVVAAEVGAASAIKMIRSVMVKGMEALQAECFLAARKAGVEGEVLASLTASNPEFDWPARGNYNLERMMTHGLRRAAEMREVAGTLRDLGLGAGMSAAAAEWQEKLGQLGLNGTEGDLWHRTDLILARL